LVSLKQNEIGAKEGKYGKVKKGGNQFFTVLLLPIFPFPPFPTLTQRVTAFGQNIPFFQGLPKIFVAPNPYPATTYNPNFPIPQEFS
jgi:hypothetical protein